MMEQIKLAIITGDEEYGKALSIGLVGLYRNFSVTLYKAVQLKRFRPDDYDLILCDLEEAMPEKGLRLAEKPSMAVLDPEEKRFVLYKYENVRTLAGQLLLIYTILTGRRVVRLRNEDMNLLVFAAAEGGVGCTSAALAAAQELQRFHNKKVLYLSLEEIESTARYMKIVSKGKGISDYLYLLFSEKEENNGGPFPESFLIADDYGVEAFAPSAGKNLLTGLSAEEMQYFISTLINTGRYDYIIIDAGCRLDNPVLCCYEMANRIFLVTKKSIYPGKEEKYLEYLMFLKGEKLVSKMNKIENFVCDPEPGESRKKEAKGGEEPMIGTIVSLGSDPAGFSAEEKRIRIHLDSRFGIGISRLVGLILKKTQI